jgi:hypothetical protein
MSEVFKMLILANNQERKQGMVNQSFIALVPVRDTKNNALVLVLTSDHHIRKRMFVPLEKLAHVWKKPYIPNYRS